MTLIFDSMMHGRINQPGILCSQSSDQAVRETAITMRVLPKQADRQPGQMPEHAHLLLLSGLICS